MAKRSPRFQVIYKEMRGLKREKSGKREARVVVVVVWCSIHSVSLAEAGRYRYSLQGDDWPERVRVASSGAQYKEESLSL